MMAAPRVSKVWETLHPADVIAWQHVPGELEVTVDQIKGTLTFGDNYQIRYVDVYGDQKLIVVFEGHMLADLAQLYVEDLVDIVDFERLVAFVIAEKDDPWMELPHSMC